MLTPCRTGDTTACRSPGARRYTVPPLVVKVHVREAAGRPVYTAGHLLPASAGVIDPSCRIKFPPVMDASITRPPQPLKTRRWGFFRIVSDAATQYFGGVMVTEE
jgi:hypothetical protein